MKLTELAVKPQLVSVSIDDEDIIEEYGEPLEFYVWDRQPIEKFVRFAGQEITPEVYPDLVRFCQELILDEHGEQVMVDGKLLPASVMSKAITRVMQELGK